MKSLTHGSKTSYLLILRLHRLEDACGRPPTDLIETPSISPDEKPKTRVPLVCRDEPKAVKYEDVSP